MKSMSIPLALCLLCGAVLAADAPRAAEKKQSDDARAIQGNWQLVRHEVGDQARDEEASKRRFVFDGNQFRLMEDDREVAKGTFKLDASRTPRTIDIEITESSEPDSQGRTAVGIYELKGDELKWCTAQPGSDQRPTQFATKGTQNMMATFHRKTAEKK